MTSGKRRSVSAWINPCETATVIRVWSFFSSLFCVARDHNLNHQAMQMVKKVLQKHLKNTVFFSIFWQQITIKIISLSSRNIGLVSSGEYHGSWVGEIGWMVRKTRYHIEYSTITEGTDIRNSQNNEKSTWIL